MLLALLSVLALLLCQGWLPSLGVLGREPKLGLTGGWRADCAVPSVIVDPDLREDFRVVAVESVAVEDVLLHLLSLSPRSGVGVKLREELREWDPCLSRPLSRRLGRRFLLLPMCARLWL
jgi:hypothetical protein